VVEASGNRVIVFGDGACIGNPGPGGWGAVIATPQQVVERGGGDSSTTNNRMEMQALLVSLQELKRFGVSQECCFYWDSQYVLSGVTAWRASWEKRGWKTAQGDEIKNLDLWKEIYSALDALPAPKRWFYVPGHEGYAGNERVDEIAFGFAEGSIPDLFEGPRSSYSVEVFESVVGLKEFEPNRGSFSKPKKSPAYYLSLINGQVFRDVSWGSCQARTKGVSGAKFKKVHGDQEEAETLKQWGVKPL